MTKIGVDRVLKFAFNLAKQTKRKHLTSATKSTAFQLRCLTGMRELKKYQKFS